MWFLQRYIEQKRESPPTSIWSCLFLLQYQVSNQDKLCVQALWQGKKLLCNSDMFLSWFQHINNTICKTVEQVLGIRPSIECWEWDSNLWVDLRNFFCYCCSNSWCYYFFWCFVSLFCTFNNFYCSLLNIINLCLNLLLNSVCISQDRSCEWFHTYFQTFFCNIILSRIFIDSDVL